MKAFGRDIGDIGVLLDYGLKVLGVTFIAHPPAQCVKMTSGAGIDKN